MALRLFTKINSCILQNFGKVTNEIAETLASVRRFSDDHCSPKKPPTPAVQNEKLQPLPGRHVFFKRPSDQPQSEAELLQNNLRKHHLQPALQPQFYEPPIDLKPRNFPDPPQQESQYRKFEASKTYQSVTLPLRQPRLASPFPDPVKVMPSDTISDQEKAEQMQAESRLPKASSSGGGGGSGGAAHPPVNYNQVRSFASSSGSKKCPKLKEKKGDKKPCPRMVPPGVKPPPSIVCDDSRLPPPCGKKKAPYPAYSEFCHTIVDEHPSECKMCPWKPSEHPTFKPPKKKYHTSSITFTPRRWKSDGGRWSGRDEKDKKRGVIDEPQNASSRAVINRDGTLVLFDQQRGNKEIVLGFYCSDMRKKPCKRPKSNMCKGSKSKKKKDDKKSGSKKHHGKDKKHHGKDKKHHGKDKKHHGKDKKHHSKDKKHKKTSKKPKKSKKSSHGGNVKEKKLSPSGSWVTLNELVQEFPLAFGLREPPTLRIERRKIAGPSKKKGPGKGRCTKVPFRGCNVVKKKPKRVSDGKCPKPLRRKKVKDCPQEKCGPLTGASTGGSGYLMKGGDKDKDKGHKCPKVTNETCQEKREGDHDPCKPKKKDTTKKCPKDLLKKRRWRPQKPPLRKTSGVATPKLEII